VIHILEQSRDLTLSGWPLPVRQSLARHCYRWVSENAATKRRLYHGVVTLRQNRASLQDKADRLDDERSAALGREADFTRQCRALSIRVDNLTEERCTRKVAVAQCEVRHELHTASVARLDAELDEELKALHVKGEEEVVRPGVLASRSADPCIADMSPCIIDCESQMLVRSLVAEPCVSTLKEKQAWRLIPTAEALTTQAAALRCECACLTARAEMLTRDVDAATNRVTLLKRKHDELSARVIELRDELSDLERRQQTLQADVDRLTATIDVLQTRLDTVRKQLRGTYEQQEHDRLPRLLDIAVAKEMERLADQVSDLACADESYQVEVEQEKNTIKHSSAYERVRIAVTVPAAVQRARVFRTNVVVDSATSDAVARLAADMADAGRVVLKPLGGAEPEAEVTHGTAIVLFLEIADFCVEPASHRLVWDGKREQASFFCSVPDDWAQHSLKGHLTVVLEGSPSGSTGQTTQLDMDFEIPITDAVGAGRELDRLLQRWTTKLVDRGFAHGVRGSSGEHTSWGVPSQLTAFVPLAHVPAIVTLTALVRDSGKMLAEIRVLHAQAIGEGLPGVDDLVVMARAVMSLDVAALDAFLLKLARRRLQSSRSIMQMRTVESAGVNLFEDCYSAVWRWVADTDTAGVRQYCAAMVSIKHRLAEGGCPAAAQPSHDAVELFINAIDVMPAVTTVLERLCRVAFDPHIPGIPLPTERVDGCCTAGCTVRSDLGLRDESGAAFCCVECQTGLDVHGSACTATQRWASKQTFKFGGTRCTLTVAPIKSVERICEKVSIRMMQECANRFAQSPPDSATLIPPSAMHVKDVARAMVELHTMEDIAAFCTSVMDSDEVEVIKVKERFLGDWEEASHLREPPCIAQFESALTQGGWRDVMLSVVLPQKSTHILEIQVHQSVHLAILSQPLDTARSSFN
jgi:hypothetical protein